MKFTNLFIQCLARFQCLAEIKRFSIKINAMVEVCPLDGTVQFPPLEFYLSEILASGSQIKVGAGTIFPVILAK